MVVFQKWTAKIEFLLHCLNTEGTESFLTQIIKLKFTIGYWAILDRIRNINVNCIIFLICFAVWVCFPYHNIIWYGLKIKQSVWDRNAWCILQEIRDVTCETNEGQGLGIQNRIAVFLFLTKISPTCLISINFFYLTCISLIFFNLLSRSGAGAQPGAQAVSFFL